MLRFYCQALGCSVERRQDAIGLVQLRAGRSLIDLVPVDGKLGKSGGAPPGAEARNLDLFCLRVEPFDEASIHLNAHGVEAGNVESRYGAEGEGPFMYLTDSEGNVIELKGPPAGYAFHNLHGGDDNVVYNPLTPIAAFSLTVCADAGRSG